MISPILPWLLVLILDGSVEIMTEQRFDTQEACRSYGESLVAHMMQDLRLINHTVEPQCYRRG